MGLISWIREKWHMRGVTDGPQFTFDLDDHVVPPMPPVKPPCGCSGGECQNRLTDAEDRKRNRIMNASMSGVPKPGVGIYRAPAVEEPRRTESSGPDLTTLAMTYAMFSGSDSPRTEVTHHVITEIPAVGEVITTPHESTHTITETPVAPAPVAEQGGYESSSSSSYESSSSSYDSGSSSFSSD